MVACFSSDGATNNGLFCEALNLAAVWKLPFVVVVENNQYAVSTTIEEQTGETELYKRGHGVGVHSVRINGNDVLEVYGTMQEAIERCQAGEGPMMIECMTYRQGGHHVNDPGLYMPKEELEYYQSIDPCLVGKRYLMEMGGASEVEIKAIEDEVQQVIDDAVEFAQRSPEPSIEQFLQEAMAN